MMVQARALIAALLLTVVSGCLGDRAATSSSWLRPFQGVTGPDAVYLDVALIQIPQADAGRFRELWTFIDEGFVPLDKKGPFEENGFRVGQVGLNPPAELIELLSEPRFCPDPRRIQLKSCRDERCLDIAAPLSTLSFQLMQNGQSTPVELDKAQCCLGLAPSPEGNRIRLTVTPKVRHEKKSKMPWLPNSDRSGWTLNLQQPTESFPSAGFEVVLGPDDYVVIGPRLDRPGTLGYETFARFDEPVPVQRLLVLRAWRPSGLSPDKSESDGQGPTPLALQASRTSFRGIAPR